MTQPNDPRRSRLEHDREHLEVLNKDSDHVRVAVRSLPGYPPERFLVTFECKGIVGRHTDNYPVFGDHHEVEIYCDHNYPAEPPQLTWLTPIWHPNIKHTEPRTVCVNRFEWLAGLDLFHLCWQMFDMVQYRNYHADETAKPYPMDHDAAEWVRNFAEPRDIVNKKKGIYVDDKPFLRATRKAAQSSAASATNPTLPVKPRVRFTDAPVPQVRISTQAAGVDHCAGCGRAVRTDQTSCPSCGRRRIRFKS